MSARDLPLAVRDLLARRGGPASSLLLAREVLNLSAPDERIATSILETVLRPAGFLYLEGRGWALPHPASDRSSPQPRPTERPPAPPSAGAGPGPGTTAGTEAPVRLVACAVVPQAASGRPGGRAGTGIADLCLVPVSGGSGRPLCSVRWDRISSLLMDAHAVFTDPRREAPPILAGLAARGLPGPSAVRSLSGTLRGLPGLAGRTSSTAEIAERLGVPYREEERAEAAAANIAAILERALGRGGPVARGRRRGVAGGSSCPALSAEFLEGVPEAPGTYRFLDEGGGVLYVGKASNLRRRLSAHAAAAASGRPSAGRPMAEAIHRVRRVEYKVLGSDLEAVLAEASALSFLRSGANVQRRVRDRGRRFGPDRLQALLLPSSDPGAASVVLMMNGRYAGWCRIGPRGGGLRKAETLVRGLFRPDARAPVAGQDARSEILARWLGRYGERFSRVDLDSFAGPGAALRAIRDGARETARHAGDVTLYRAVRGEAPGPGRGRHGARGLESRRRGKRDPNRRA